MKMTSYKNMKYIVAILGLFILMPITGSGQIVITDKVRYDICYKAFGTEIEYANVLPDGSYERIGSVYPTDLVHIRSLITGKCWKDDVAFETMPYDMLEVTAVSDWHDQIFLVMGQDIIYFDIYHKFPVVVRRLFRILKKYKVDKTLYPVFCRRLSHAYMVARYWNDYPLSETEKLYRDYWLLL